MRRRTMRGAVAVAALCAVALLGGCGDNSGPEDVSGSWEGTLTLQFLDGSALDGALTLVLVQDDDFASGGVEWAPIGETQSVAGPIDGIDVTLRLLFRCEKSFELTVLEGTIDGDTLEIDEAAGMACTLGGTPTAVGGASATLTRDTTGLPF